MANRPREVGTAWERRVVDYAVEHDGLRWERAPLHGSEDLLDVQGCQWDGWLIGCKGITRTGNMADKMSDAMIQAQRARANARGLFGDDLIPVQVMQRQGYKTGQAYVVLELDDFLALVLERRKWRQQ